MVVPRSSQHAYHVVSGGATGIDRAINYINYAPAIQHQFPFHQHHQHSATIQYDLSLALPPSESFGRQQSSQHQ